MSTTLPTSGDRDIGVVMMLEPGRYEWSGVLLISTLLAFAQDDIGIWAYCRRGLIDQLHPSTLDFLDRHGVRLEPIDPAFQVTYPQGNKLYACAAPRAAHATILMDTDMAMIRPARLAEAIHPGCVSGRNTSGWMWGKTVEEWRAAYASVGLEPPRLRMFRPDGSYVPVSLAAAFVTYDTPDFGAIWRDTALEIEERRLARGIYPTLDQISLPVAAVRAGLRPTLIDSIWNKGGVIGRGRMHSVVVHHYQKPERLLGSDYKWATDAVLGEFAGHDSVEALIAFYEANGARPPEVDGNEGYWDTVIRPQRQADAPHDGSARPHPAKDG